MIGNRQHGHFVLVLHLVAGEARAWYHHVVEVIFLSGRWIELSAQHHFLKENDGAHRVVEGQLVLVELGEHGADIKVGIGLSFRSLQSTLDRQCPLQEVEGGPHFTDSPVVAGHVVEGHCLTELVVLAELLGLLEEVECAVDVLFLEVVYGEDVADFAQLFAALGELFRVGTEV